LRPPTLRALLCDTENMPPSTDPRSVDVKLTAGTGVDIEWRDGHRSSYTFQFLRDACPCAMCNEERNRVGRKPGEGMKSEAGVLPLFKPVARATEAEPVGRYAIRFTWNDGHAHGIYSWEYLREVCPCEQCKAAQVQSK